MPGVSVPVVLMVGEIAAHVQDIADLMAKAPPEIQGRNRFITAGLDVSGRQAVDNLIERVFADPTNPYLTYVVVVELRAGGRLSDQAADMLSARRPFALLGWAPADDYTPLACQGLDCCVGPVLKQTVEECARIWGVFDQLSLHQTRLLADHPPLRLAVVTGMADASATGPLANDVFEDIPGAAVVTRDVVGLDTAAAHVRGLLGNFRHSGSGVVDGRRPAPPPGTLGLAVIAAVARVQGGDLAEFDRALAWLVRMEGLACRVIVASLDDASLPGFEAAVAQRISQSRVSLCYGQPNMIGFLVARVMNHVLTDEAARVDNPRVPISRARR
jgi:hypothetical protein